MIQILCRDYRLKIHDEMHISDLFLNGNIMRYIYKLYEDTYIYQTVITRIWYISR